MAESASAQCEVGQLFASLSGAGDSFGQSLDFNGDELVVGSRYSATIFVRQDSGTPLDDTDDDWVVQANLLGEHIWDKFGAAVAIDGDHLLVGAPDYGLSFGTMGAAYVFVRNDSGTPHDVSDDTWTEQVKLTGPTTDTISVFGSSVALDGDRLAVGDPWGHLVPGGPQNGFVHVARRDDGGTPDDSADDAWVTEALLLPGDGGVFFGLEVDLFGSELLIVGRGADFVNRIYRFRLDDVGTPDDPADDGWVEHGVILPPPGVLGFGQDFSRDGDQLLVGGSEVAIEYRLDDAGTPTDPLDDRWVQEGVLVASDDTQYDDAFGSAVSLHGGRALVGARKHTTLLTASGAAYLFQCDDSAVDAAARWTEIVEFAPAPNEFGAKNFGVAVLLAGDVAFVGESGFFQFIGPADSIYGKTRIYAMADEPWTFIDAALPGAGGVSPCLIGAGSLAPDLEVALVIEDAPAAVAAALVIGAGVANAPFKGGILVPVPQYIAWLATNSAGKLKLSGRWPSHVPAGFALWMQVWMADDGAPEGFVATNALRADAP